MFIDIHAHARLFPSTLNFRGWTYSLPEQVIERYDKLDIEKGVLLPGGNPEMEVVSQSNEEVLEIVRRYPDRFIPFCNIDPRQLTNTPDAPMDYLLNHYKDCGCKGLGEICSNMEFQDPLVQNLFKHAEKTDMPIIFHIAAYIGETYGLYDAPGLPQLEYSLSKFPKLKFLGHSQSFWAEMGQLETVGERRGYPKSSIEEEGAVPRLMRKYGNLYGDLSAGSGCNALSRDRDYAVKFLTEFQDRLFFGTDICPPDTPTPLVDFLLELRNSKKITEEVFQKVAKGNAIKILDLE